MIEEVTDFQFCSTIINNNDNSVDTNSNSLIGAWKIHSIYNLNFSIAEWESHDLDDPGGADIVIDADNIS